MPENFEQPKFIETKLESRELTPDDKASLSVLIDALVDSRGYKDSKPVFQKLEPDVFSFLLKANPDLAQRIRAREEKTEDKETPKVGKPDNLNFLPDEIYSFLENGDYLGAVSSAAHLPSDAGFNGEQKKQPCLQAVTRYLLGKEPDVIPKIIDELKQKTDISNPQDVESLLHAYDAILNSINASSAHDRTLDLEEKIGTVALELIPHFGDEKKRTGYIQIKPGYVRHRDDLEIFIGLTAGKNKDKALELREQFFTAMDEEYGKRRSLYKTIAALARGNNLDEAEHLWSETTTAERDYERYSGEKVRAMVSIALARSRGGNEQIQDLLMDYLKRSGDAKDHLLAEEVVALAQYSPQEMLEYLHRRLGSISYTDKYFDITPRDIIEVLERAGISDLEKQKEWLYESGANKMSTNYKVHRKIFRRAILSNLRVNLGEVLSPEGVNNYFRSITKQEDLKAFIESDAVGLITGKNIETSDESFKPYFLTVEVYKKTDFDLASFDHLTLLAQSGNDSMRETALHGIKLLQPKVAELFYSSNQQYQDVLKKLYGLSPEAQQWFADLDEHIAENFDTQNLIRLVTKLGEEEALQMFPQAMAKAREEILAHLPSNEDLADYFLENLHLYQTQPWAVQGIEGAIKHFPVAQKFIKVVDGGVSPWKDASWVANVYAKAKLTKPHDEEEWDEERGAESQGFSETDPYENHHWKFTVGQIKIAGVLSDVLAGKSDEESIKQLNLSPESLKTLKSVEQHLNTAYENFLSEIESSSTFPEEDKRALLHPENSSVRMTDLRDNIRSFIARYLTQMAEGDIAKLNKELGDISENLEKILQEGLRRFIKIYEVDVPLYDKLYEEFDNLRETGQYPLEVYLGRDGIYAWLGRRAQDVARRRKLGLKGRKQAKEAGEVIEIQPKYLIYPRYFRDSINYETKREFLEQEGISPDADPMFYDTGYTGTIPEQIMRVMDFENEEIERRIRLLSAPVVHRRVKGIPENARAEVIEYIEHNAKTENTAVGLIKDPETGRIRPIAKPTAPDEQFYFMMVKQAVGRHYWLKEQLHHEPSGNINLDSEHYLIRVRQEYSSLLPPAFISDPKTYLAQQGKLLKGSKGEGEYPDEEVVLFKLSDDTEIVAKRVELRKAKEARKEFSILIAARKANLPTAEPVGFLSGKTEADSSFLLMKKIEGFSGRKFEKHLRDSGKYNDEQVKSIMQVVAEKNKEMAELFRETLNIDKRWRIKDTIIEFDEETGKVAGVTPIGWERVQSYDPSTPKEIDEIA